MPVINRSFFLFFLYLCLEPGLSHAQVKPTPKHVDLIHNREEENLNVLQDWLRWSNPGALLINYLNQQTFDYYDMRDRMIAKLKTKGDWIERQQQVRKTLRDLVGTFPKKNALNPRVTGVIQKEGYRIEKIIYESMPEFYVPACLFIPDHIDGTAPAVLNLIGHEQESFRAELDQLVMVNLVKKGIIVMSIDPPGQGEHVQYFDPSIGCSSIGYSAIEHSYFGNQCFLTGTSSARYFIWDAIRAIDYLVLRKEVDPDRIGVTGFSGGGTITSYLGALDDRVKVAVPCSWSTASRRQLETKGAQDAEAEIYLSLKRAITFEDLIEARAPKPTLMTFTSRDQYLTLQGAYESFTEIKKAYLAFNKSDQLALVEDDYQHWLTPKIRLAIYAFFMKHFNISGDPTEQEIELLSSEELKVTSTGQISTSVGGQMIFDVQKYEVEKWSDDLDISRIDVLKHLKLVASEARDISGYITPPDHTGAPFINGRYQRDGYTVTKYALQGEGDYPIPFLLFIPEDHQLKHSTLVYLHPDGKQVNTEPGGEIEQLVRNGYVVAAVDVLGSGETKNTATRDLAIGYTGLLIGKSVVAIQAGDIVRVVNYLKSNPAVDSDSIGAIAYDQMCIPLIHAAAFDTSIVNIALIRPLISYRSIAMNRDFRVGLIKNEGGGTGHPYEVEFSWGVAGALTAYDLPDLIGCLAPRKVILAEISNHMSNPASAFSIEAEMAFPRSVYTLENAGGKIKVVASYDSLVTLLRE